ncbi:MAG: hypothetical protein KDE59_28280 [Anaerolineales bacterium]|nr:hypothetical protein [Anaerolineales bacterium]MCB0030608.1 hypothetical protein [Anaerolineales bacterium]
METIKLQLSVDEINIILEALGKEPFTRVYALIGKIQEQAQRQIGQNEQPDPAAAGGIDHE